MSENEKNNGSPEDISSSLSTDQLIELLKLRSDAFTPEQQKAFGAFQTAFAKPTEVLEGKISNEYPIFQEVEKIAEELARELRETGAGNIYGIFPRSLLTKDENYSYRGGWTNLFAFLKGVDIDIKDIDAQLRVGLYSQTQILKKAGELTDRRFSLQENTHRQIWLSGNIPQNTYSVYGIGKGEFRDGQMRAFHMPILHPDRRPGGYDVFKIVGPGDLIHSIDEEVEKSPYFPDALFRHVYPNMVGPNRDKNITRIEAMELQILRYNKEDSEQTTSQIIGYSHPIPY